MPKVTAFTCGARFGNSEIFAKVALQALQRMGIETELIRLNDCDLRPCIGCPNKLCSKGPEHCIHKDDGGWLTYKFFESDGYLISAPVWSLAPTSIVSVFRDRVFGYKADIAGWERRGVPKWAEGMKKQRPGALISVGGALTRHWTSLSMATLYTTAFSTQTNIVDQMDVWGVSAHGEAVQHPDLMLRAKYLGENLGHALLNPQIDWTGKFLGDDDGEACPSCHLSLLLARPGNDYVECAVCGRRGKVDLVDGKLSYTWPEDKQNRLTMMGKFDHMREIERHGMLRHPYTEAEQAELDALKQWNDCVLTPPSRQKKAE